MWDEPNRRNGQNAPTERFSYQQDDDSTDPYDPYNSPPPYQPPAYQRAGAPRPEYRPAYPPTQPAPPAYDPAYDPGPPRYPNGRPPQWPDAQRQQQQQQFQSPPLAPAQRPRRDPYADERDYAPAQRRQTPRPERSEPERRSRHHGYRALPHLPIAHVFLIAGLVAMAFAITRAWAVDTSGNPVFVQNFTNGRIVASTGFDTGALASKVAIGIVGLAAILAAVMILINMVVTLLNRILGLIGLGGVASLLLVPVLWGAGLLLFIVLLGAAGFAGVGKLSALPFIQAHGLALVNVDHYTSGFYLWCGGIVAVFIGMLGQLALRRR